MDEAGELQLIRDIIPNRVTGLGTLKSLLEDISFTPLENQKYSPRLIDLAKLSLTLLRNVGKSRYDNPSSKDRGIVYCGCRYIKGVVGEMIDLSQEKTPISQMFSRLRDTVLCFAVIAAVPEVVVRQTSNHSTQDKYIHFFISANIGGKKIKATPEEVRDYTPFNRAVLGETEATRQGILGEFLGFCLLRNQGLSPSFSSVEEDVKYGIDFYVNHKGQQTPVQIKTDSYLSPQEINLPMKLTEINGGKKLLLVVNTKRLTHDQQTLESVIYPEKPGNIPFNIGSKLKMAA